MTNQKYIEEIIKVAQQGDWKPKKLNGKTLKSPTYVSMGDGYSMWKHNVNEYFYLTHEVAFLDPNFYRAIGKVKGWEQDTEYDLTTGEQECLGEWYSHAMDFYGINLEKDLDHAIEWLYKLIKE